MTTKGTYTDLATVKDYLKITTTAEDTTLTRLITTSSDWVDNYCQRTFGSEIGTTRTLNGSGTKRQPLPEDVYAVTLLEVAMYEGAAFNTVPSSDFFLEPENTLMPGWPFQWIEFGLLPSTSVGAFFRGHRTVRVTGNWGWAAVPAVVAEATVALVAAIHKRRLAGPTDTVGVTEMGTPVIGRLIPEYVHMLGAYRDYASMGSTAAAV